MTTERQRAADKWRFEQVRNAANAAHIDALALKDFAQRWMNKFGEWTPEVEPVPGYEFADIIVMMRAMAGIEVDKHVDNVAAKVAEDLEVI